MVRVRNETSNYSKDCKWIDLHVRCRLGDLLFGQGNETVVFFIYIQVFDYALSDEVREIFEPHREIIDVFLIQNWSATLTYD